MRDTKCDSCREKRPWDGLCPLDRKQKKNSKPFIHKAWSTGADTQIRTGDLILTNYNRPENSVFYLVTTYCILTVHILERKFLPFVTCCYLSHIHVWVFILSVWVWCGYGKCLTSSLIDLQCVPDNLACPPDTFLIRMGVHPKRDSRVRMP